MLPASHETSINLEHLQHTSRSDSTTKPAISHTDAVRLVFDPCWACIVSSCPRPMSRTSHQPSASMPQLPWEPESEISAQGRCALGLQLHLIWRLFVVPAIQRSTFHHNSDLYSEASRRVARRSSFRHAVWLEAAANPPRQAHQPHRQDESGHNDRNNIATCLDPGGLPLRDNYPDCR